MVLCDPDDTEELGAGAGEPRRRKEYAGGDQKPTRSPEIKIAMKRQGATPRGLKKRIGDLDFGKISDRRVAEKVKVTLPALLTALVAAMVTKARSLRAVEQGTAQMACKLGSFFGVHRRIADNTFGKVIPRLLFSELVRCLHRLVKAEHRRGSFEPRVLPAGAIAIDGKNVATLRWHDLCRVLKLEPREATAKQVRLLLAKRYPEAQLCAPEMGEPYALMRVHTVTLISSKAAVCVHQRPIAGHTNEVGSMSALIGELKEAYGRTLISSLDHRCRQYLARGRESDRRGGLELFCSDQVGAWRPA
jgi:hypothetical protein